MMRAKNVFFLTATAMIWGLGFVSQLVGGDALGPYSFSFLRCFIAAITLIPFVKIFSDKKELDFKAKKLLRRASVLCGIPLGGSFFFLQLGMFLGTGAGKSGFIIAFYIVAVPVIGIFLGKRCGANVYLAVFLALIGLYLLCIKNGFHIQRSDGLVVVSAVMVAIQILTIDHYVEQVDPVRLTQLQFVAAGVLMLIPTVFLDWKCSPVVFLDWLGNFRALGTWIAVLYSGVIGSGIGYTFQTLGQKGADPSVASLLLSLESVFSVLFGWLILGEVLSIREIAGCAVMFAAVILAQIPFKSRNRQVS